MKKKNKTIKYRTIMRSPSDKWILPESLNTKKQRKDTKKELNCFPTDIIFKDKEEMERLCRKINHFE